jgi:RNA polymerase sigma factor (sigma-70 family)
MFASEIDSNISLSDFALSFDILVNMSETDLQLLTRYANQRAEDAFAEIVRRHIDLVHSAALRQVRSRELAEEVAQAVFVELARQARNLPPHTVLAAWLYQVTRRRAIDVVRRETGRRIREQTAQELQAMNATAEDWTHIEPLLDDAMNALEETDRLAVLLRYFQNKPLREVGEAMGMTDDAAQKRVSRAVERLREFFAKRGIAVGASGLTLVVSANAVQAAPVGLVVTISSAVGLTGATVFTNATSKLQLAIMSKLKLSAVSALVIAGVATPLVLQHQTVTRLRSENFALQEQVRQAQVLRGENDKMPAQLSAVRQESQTNTDTSELLRLRGEAGRLRALEADVAKLREESSRYQFQARKAMEELAATQQGTLEFAVQRVTSIDALKQVGHQLRELAAAGNLGAAFTADGKLNPNLIIGTHPNFDMGRVELAVSDVSQLPKLLHQAPDTIVARTTEAVQTPDDRWMRFYLQADGSVQNYSTPFSNQVFSANWQLERLKP